MINKLSANFSVSELCSALNVSRSSYYSWLKRKPSKRALQNLELSDRIIAIHRESKAAYGSPRIIHALRKYGQSCGKNRIEKLMRLYGLRGAQKRRFRPRTTIADKKHTPAPNLLKNSSPPSQSNQIWVSDITYIRTRHGWAYLAAVMDLHSRSICGWDIGANLSTSLISKALKIAVARCQPSPGLLFHSDRGCQYTSSEFRSLLTLFQFRQSMSAAGNCYDNAAMESFWSTLKAECVRSTIFDSIHHARTAIFEYIESFYNRRRLHSALDFQSPLDFLSNPSKLN